MPEERGISGIYLQEFAALIISGIARGYLAISLEYITRRAIFKHQVLRALALHAVEDDGNDGFHLLRA